VEDELERDSVVRLTDEIRRRILGMRTLNPQNSLDSFERLFTNIRIREKPVDRIRTAAHFLKSVLAREVHRKAVPIIPRLILLPVRILRLVWKSCLTLLILIGHVFDFAPLSKAPSPSGAEGALRKVT
jgi:hypothetical protein